MIFANSSFGIGITLQATGCMDPSAAMRQLPAGSNGCVQFVILSDCGRLDASWEVSERNFHDHFGAVRARALDDEFAAMPGHAFVQVEQAEAARLARRAGSKPMPLSMMLIVSMPRGLLQAHVDPACQRMAEYIVQAFLQHPVHASARILRPRSARRCRRPPMSSQAMPLARVNLRSSMSTMAQQPEFQAGRTQFAQQLLDRAQREIDIVERGADAVAQAVVALGGVLVQHHDVDAQVPAGSGPANRAARAKCACVRPRGWRAGAQAVRAAFVRKRARPLRRVRRQRSFRPAPG